MTRTHRWLARRVGALMRRDIRSHFRRIVWRGAALPSLDLPLDRPLVAYANHMGFYDGHLMWWLLHDQLGREPTVWMTEWHRFPIFGPAGAQPFPEDDARARIATIRRTARRMTERPQTALIYFPEGHLHNPDDGLLPWPEDAFARLARLLPDAIWWPVGMHQTWEGDPRPTLILGGGTPRDTPEGAREHLERVWLRLREPTGDDTETTLMQGPPGPHERWDLSLLARPLRRFL